MLAIASPARADPAADYRAAVLADSPISFWRLGEASGSRAMDQLGRNPGTISNATLSQPGPIIGDASMRFDGTGEVNVGTSATLRPPGNWTVELWFKATAEDAAKCANDFGGDSCHLYRLHPKAMYVVLLKDGRLQGAINETNAVTTPTSYDDGQWHHVALVHSGSSLLLYVDGTLQATASGVPTTTTYCCENVGAIANDGACHCSPLWGWESEVALYGYGLSPSRIAVHHSFARPKDAPLVWIVDPSGARIGGGASASFGVPFADTDPAPNLGDLSATVDWGDGQTSTARLVAPRIPFVGIPRGVFLVTASHTYTAPHPQVFPVRVTVIDRDGSQLQATGSYAYLPDALRIKLLNKQAAIGRLVPDFQAAQAWCAITFIVPEGEVVSASVLKSILGKLATSGGGFLGGIFCDGAVRKYISDLQQAYDPPSSNYARVYRPPPVRVPNLLRVHCKHKGARMCSRLLGALQRYANSMVVEASLSEAVTVSLDRYSGALFAHAAKAARRQARAVRGYLGLQRAALKALRRAARALAAELRRDRVDMVISAALLPRALSDLLNLKHVPRSLVRALERTGLVSSTTQLQLDLASLLSRPGVPNRISILALLAREGR